MNSASLGTTAAGHNKCSIPDSRNVEDCPVGRDSVAAVQVPSESIAINIWIEYTKILENNYHVFYTNPQEESNLSD
jgi:hypothetical protein